MKQPTSVRIIGGSTYLLIPPHFVEHCKFEEGGDTAIIEDKNKGKGNFLAAWSKKTDLGDGNGKKS